MIVVNASERPPAERLTGEGAVAIAIGNFDGVHAGHRSVLGKLLALAAAAGIPAWVYTFDPAPTAVLVPERHQPRLLTLPRKLELLAALGINGVVVEAFTPAFAAQTAEAFARRTLVDRLGASVIVVGWDFRFGAGRGGDFDALRAALPGATLEQVPPLLVDDAPVSSSRVRRLIAAGDVTGAAALLGRPHRIAGEVVHGDARGRTIGVPTANLSLPPELCLPAHGVYAVHALGRQAVLNLGVRPTFGGSALRAEVHILDWEGDLYGQVLAVDVITRIRGEQRFESVEALKRQIAADITVARAVGA